MATQPWHVDFFTGLFVESLRAIAKMYPTAAEADFIAQELGVPSGGSILDVPCGNGRISIALAEQGFALSGIDGCPEILADARAAAKDRNLAIDFRQGDMRELPWRDHFDGVCCCGNSFAYFDEAGNMDFLKSVRAALKPGGRFVMNSGLIAESIFPHQSQRRWFPMGDLFFLHNTRYEPATAQQISSYTLIKDGQIERKEAVYHVYTFKQLADLFNAVGLKILNTYSSLKREPFQLGSQDFWVVAEK